MDELNIILKKITLQFLCIITAIYIFYSIFYCIEGLRLYALITIAILLVNILLICIPYKLNYESIKLLVPIYLVFISIAVSPIIIFRWKEGDSTCFAWLFIIPVASMLFSSLKMIISWFVYIFVLIISIFLITPIIPNDLPISFTESQLTFTTFTTILFSLLLMFLSLYSFYKVGFHIMFNDKYYHNSDDFKEEIIKESIDEKYEDLYDQILEYFEQKKPYCDPDFTISQLAIAISSNVNYISRAIKRNRDVNFNLFINIYRVTMIKEMLDKDLQNKYTIRHIYTSCGFKHQSTFNKVFKQIEGVTPSDYIKNHLK